MPSRRRPLSPDETSPDPPTAEVPTLADVAARAGVSRMSVSRALDDKGGVSPATRERILQVARDLGYRRNDSARTLRLGASTGLIGLVVSNLSNPFYANVAIGVETAVGAAGLRMLLVNTHEDPDVEERLIGNLVERRVEGIVVVPSGADHSHLAPSALLGTPVVFVGRPPGSIQADSVVLDDFGGAYRITRRLLQAGHHRIAFLENPSVRSDVSERYRGYCEAYGQARIPIPRALVARECVDTSVAETTCRRLLAGQSPPTAIFATNNRLLLGVLLATHQTHEEVALAAFDAIEYRRLINRDLLLASYDPVDLGHRAGEMLLSRMTTGVNFDAFPPMRITVPVELAYGVSQMDGR